MLNEGVKEKKKGGKEEGGKITSKRVREEEKPSS